MPGLELDGVHPALPFLVANGRRVLGTPDPEQRPIAGWAQPMRLPELRDKRVVVLGGGDTGMDCVRTAVRLGAASVSCVYRRDEASMPGSRREVKHAREEGVQFLFNRQPLELVGDGAVRGVRIVETRADPGSARVRSAVPTALPGSERVLPAEIVIVAFGFRADPPPWLVERGVELDAQRLVRVNGSGRLPYQTANPKLFAGGDMTRGADLVVTAVADGREAAHAIARWLGVHPPPGAR
jgi:glutamate synthase (NADPH/NADH) small chain